MGAQTAHASLMWHATLKPIRVLPVLRCGPLILFPESRRENDQSGREDDAGESPPPALSGHKALASDTAPGPSVLLTETMECDLSAKTIVCAFLQALGREFRKSPSGVARRRSSPSRLVLRRGVSASTQPSFPCRASKRFPAICRRGAAAAKKHFRISGS